MIAKSVLIGAAMSLIASAAQTAPCDPGHRMSSSQITAAVTGKYTCVGTFPNATWNELLSGGTVTDYKLGPGDPTDPTTQVGTYTIGGVNDNTTGGVLTYFYSAETFAYLVDTGTADGTLGSSPFTFCPVGGGANLVVNVQAGHC